MRSIGAGAAGGIGEAIANHIIEGRPPFDMYNLVSTYLINTYRMNHQCCPGGNRPETPLRPLAKSLVISAIYTKFKLIITHKFNVYMAGITSDLAKKFGLSF